MIATESLKPQFYCSHDIYQKEQSAIFAKCWIFVGFMDQLAKPHDFVTTEIAGLPIVVQNFDGQLSALLNVCSHRKARLQTAASGNRPLRCPYHCWSFKADGQLGGVPLQRTDFAFTEDEKKNLALRQFRVAHCGQFVFVSLDDAAPALDDYLGKYAALLRDLSTYFFDPVAAGCYDWQTNWKLAVETVLEVYHVAGVHPDSFAKLARPECEVRHESPHNAGFTPLTETTKQWWARVRRQLKLQQYPELTEYNHFFIYPNLAIGLTNGSLMSVQTYEPVSVTQCRLNYRLRMIGCEQGVSVEGAFKTAVLQNFTDFNHQTLTEDQAVAESCQLNMAVVQTPGVLGRCEERLVLFHQAWRESMENE
jgi:phenylpropionate dioxygenase-like ring-hydroxylating dioxygenase large terminal subunit